MIIIFKIFQCWCLLITYLIRTFFHCNIQSFIRGIGRLIRQRQNQCIIEIGTTLAIPFNIFTDVWFHCVKTTKNEAVLQSLGVGFRRSIKKFDLSLIEDEWKMLSQSICQPTSPIGLNLRFSYFYVWKFSIWGYFKLKNVNFEIISLM
jgi:hypothetical protein